MTDGDGDRTVDVACRLGDGKVSVRAERHRAAVDQNLGDVLWVGQATLERWVTGRIGGQGQGLDRWCLAQCQCLVETAAVGEHQCHIQGFGGVETGFRKGHGETPILGQAQAFATGPNLGERPGIGDAPGNPPTVPGADRHNVCDPSRQTLTA